MTPEEAAERQQDVVGAPSGLFVRACPGAGKTRTVVDRFVRIADEGAGAVAVISFTNRASAEVSKRCVSSGRPELATFPHYVGTLDRFIAMYIVRPFGDFGGPIRIVDSWDALDVVITAFGVQGQVSLDHFAAGPDGVLRFAPRAGDPAAEGPALLRLEKNARERLDALRADGYLTCDDARRDAIDLLAGHAEIADLIRERFVEIIVDEAQDCSVDELALLKRLRQAGVPMVMVCDPHQSIYEWRDTDPAALDELVADLGPVELTGNWRSTPAICALAASVRGGAPDEPVGPYREDETPVAVIRYGGWPSPALGERFVKLATEAGVDARGGIILAHRASSAAQAAGATVGRGQSNVAVLATSSMRLMDSDAEPRERQRAFDRLQRLLLRMLKIDASGHTTERAADLAHVEPDWLRRSALAVAKSVGALDLDLPASEWLLAARSMVSDAAASAERTAASAGTFLPTPQNSASKTIREVLGAQAGVVGVRHATVHAAKGTEEEAVLVVLPRDRAPGTRTRDLITAWRDGATLEAKRVLYVGVTRARKLCVVAVPKGEADTVCAVLEGHAVAHQIYEL